MPTGCDGVWTLQVIEQFTTQIKELEGRLE